MGAVENTASLSSGTPASAVPPPGEVHGKPRGEPSSHQLSALLVWAVVFCDIGTSIYYVPGILYAQVGALTPLFIAATQARLEALADMYVFGLLGAFVMSSAGLDIIRWRLQRRGVGFWIGILTTLMLVVAWGVNIIEKPHATLFGGALIATGMVISITAQQGWFADLWYRIPFIARTTSKYISAAERETAEIPNLISLSEAHEIVALYPSRTLVAVRGQNRSLIEEALTREKGLGGNALYVLYVQERAGLFVGREAQEPTEEGVETLRFAAQVAQQSAFECIPVWTVSYNAAEAIARAAQVLQVDTVMMGVSRRSAVYHLLRGHVVNGLTRHLPPSCHLLLHN